MKKTILLIVLLGVLFTLNAQIEEHYYHYKGLLNGRDKFIINMTSKESTFSATVSLEDTDEVFYLRGELEGSKIVFDISVENIDSLSNVKIGKLTVVRARDNSLKGTWINNKEKKKMSFEAKENYLQSAGLKFYYLDKSMHLKNNKDYPAINIEYRYCIPTSAPIRAAYPVMMQDYAQRLFENTSTDYEKSFADVVRNIYADYCETNDFYDPEENESYMFNWVDSDNMGIEYNDKNLLVLSRSYYQYSGGAHGTYGRLFYMYDLLTGKRLKFEDIFKTSKKSALLKLIYKKVSADEELSQELFNKKFQLTESIYFDYKKVYFVYDVYEIAPYSAGEPVFSFTYDELDDYFTDYFTEKINKKFND